MPQIAEKLKKVKVIRSIGTNGYFFHYRRLGREFRGGHTEVRDIAMIIANTFASFGGMLELHEVV